MFDGAGAGEDDEGDAPPSCRWSAIRLILACDGPALRNWPRYSRGVGKFRYNLCPRDKLARESLLQYMEKNDLTLLHDQVFRVFMVTREHKELGRKEEPTAIHQRWQAAQG
nr:uncharacterized protein LOC127317665 [Lolium perenne]